MDDSVISIIMLLLGVGLMVAEVFIPSGGLLSLFAFVLVGGSYYFAWQEWHESTPGMFWGFIVISLLITPASIVGAFYILPRTSFGKRVLLEAPNLAEVTPFRREQRHLDELVGRVGKTLGLLNPGGLVEVDGERLHCESEGQIVDPGVRVVVTGHRGNSVIVRIVSEHEDEPSQPATNDVAARDEQLDFDVADQ